MEGVAEREGKKCRFGENIIHGWVRGLERFKPLFLVHQCVSHVPQGALKSLLAVPCLEEPIKVRSLFHPK